MRVHVHVCARARFLRFLGASDAALAHVGAARRPSHAACMHACMHACIADTMMIMHDDGLPGNLLPGGIPIDGSPVAPRRQPLCCAAWGPCELRGSFQLQHDYCMMMRGGCG